MLKICASYYMTFDAIAISRRTLFYPLDEVYSYQIKYRVVKAFSQSKNHASICRRNGVVSHGENIFQCNQVSNNFSKHEWSGWQDIILNWKWIE